MDFADGFFMGAMTATVAFLLTGCASGPMSNDEVTQWIHDNCDKGSYPRLYPIPEEGHRSARIVQVPAEEMKLHCSKPTSLACAYSRPGRSMGEMYLPAEDPTRYACHEQGHINGTLRCRPHDEEGRKIFGSDCGDHYTVKPEDLEPIWRIR